MSKKLEHLYSEGSLTQKCHVKCLYCRLEVAKFHIYSLYFNAKKMISEGSCDTDDWSNDVENSALHHRNKLH